MEFADWISENMEADTIKDLVNYGAGGGFPGLTYYKDTGELYNRFSEEIWDALLEDAEAFGYANVMEFVSSFNGAYSIESDMTFRNTLVWYMAEREARRLADDF